MPETIDVLLVDEDTAVLDLAETFLEQDGHLSVTAVRSIDAARDHIDSVDCVVSDYTMPEMPGHEFIELVRDRDPTMPFFVFTGRDRQDIDGEFDTETPTGYVRKGEGPDQYRDLATDIKSSLDAA